MYQYGRLKVVFSQKLRIFVAVVCLVNGLSLIFLILCLISGYFVYTQALIHAIYVCTFLQGQSVQTRNMRFREVYRKYNGGKGKFKTYISEDSIFCDTIRFFRVWISSLITIIQYNVLHCKDPQLVSNSFVPTALLSLKGFQWFFCSQRWRSKLPFEVVKLTHFAVVGCPIPSIFGSPHQILKTFFGKLKPNDSEVA